MKSLVKQSNGFTLVELLISLAVTIVLLTLALPSMQSFMDSARLVDATEQLYSHLQQARIESIARSRDIFLKVTADGTATWEYGISHRNDCEASETDRIADKACVLIVDDGDGNVHLDPADGDNEDNDDLVLMRFDSTQHPGISLSGGDITFSALRGTSSGGTINLTSPQGRELEIKVGPLGQINICNDSDEPIAGYKECPDA